MWSGDKGAGRGIRLTDQTCVVTGHLTAAASVVPEPASVALLGLGVLGLLVTRRRMSHVLTLLHRVLRFFFPASGTPAELAAERWGVDDAYANKFDPPLRREVRAAYERGWYNVNGQW